MGKHGKSGYAQGGDEEGTLQGKRHMGNTIGMGVQLGNTARMGMPRVEMKREHCKA